MLERLYRRCWGLLILLRRKTKMILAQLIELVEYGTDIEVVKWLDKTNT